MYVCGIPASYSYRLLLDLPDLYRGCKPFNHVIRYLGCTQSLKHDVRRGEVLKVLLCFIIRDTFDLGCHRCYPDFWDVHGPSSVRPGGEKRFRLFCASSPEIHLIWDVSDAMILVFEMYTFVRAYVFYFVMTMWFNFKI